MRGLPGAHRNRNESRVELRIRDDGNGFEPTARAKGFGLAGMRERAALLEGTLTVHSTRGEGTIVAATVPAHRRTETAATVEQRDLRSADQRG